ncbi:hypothetical protein NEMBOFW57_002823 [Staphylotrichum longicolle]|uniref:DUF6314 domain-containing protein n=1 Tax=Staphylotrichum longicolle TaxID=669026 RepID=A0AAD4F4H6_9PEZI|nr:hypothetical protein NEMBOFW57_002823 [Staphylotrichum longicolle]
MPKKVCIVGAGPSGLVAAKSLLHDAPRGTFDVTLFDSQTRIGGLWPSNSRDATGLVHPRMVANQSRHTVQFSDLAWPEDAPHIPRAWQVGQYLARYYQTYCSDATLCLGTRVEKVEPLQGTTDDGLQPGWLVQTRSLQDEVKEEAFDYLVHPLTNSQGHIPSEAAKTTHSVFERALGTDQSIFSPAVAVSTADKNSPPYISVSDNYMEFVRSGLINVSHGKLAGISGRVATVSPSDEEIGDIAAVVFATGFEASSSISFLPTSLKETLRLNPSDLNNTVALGFHGTYHPDIPNIGFVGFYRAPYWGVMEMQARFVTSLWAAGGPSSPSLPSALKDALSKDTSIERTIALRSDPQASQFPMGDYAWLMQEFAEALGLERSPPLGPMPRLPPADKEMDILTPARYPAKSLTEFQQAEVVKSLKQTETAAWAGVSSTKFVARAVFRSLLGEWKLERDLISKLPSHPSGHFSGTAKFLLRDGTRDGREPEFEALGEDDDRGLEYLYVEEGDFKASNGLTFRATRRYVWRYNEKKDKLSVWFVKTDDQKRADYLFHEVEFKVPAANDGQGGKGAKGWEATAGHLCIDDFYDVLYQFCFQAVNLRDWRLAYTVKGPKKDYTIDGVYSR